MVIIMTDEKPSYIAVNTYTVSKQFGRNPTGMASGAGLPLLFKDDSGNVLLTANRNMTGRHSILVDPQGQQIGYVQKKGISLGRLDKATYQFFDGSDNQIGQIVIRTGMTGMSESIKLEDPNGGIVATATGNFMGFSFQIFDADGQKTLAKIYIDTKQQEQQGEGGLKGIFAKAASAATGILRGSYKIDIVEQTINDMSRLFILELVVVLDEMYSSDHAAGFSPLLSGPRI